MAKRKASRVAFLYAVITAVVATCIILFSMMAELSRWQSLVLLLGVLIVVWAIVFSFLEVGRIASGSKSIRGPDEAVDPDAPRRLIVEPPTGHPYPHQRTTRAAPDSIRGNTPRSCATSCRPSEVSGAARTARSRPVSQPRGFSAQPPWSMREDRWPGRILRLLRPPRLLQVPPAGQCWAACRFP